METVPKQEIEVMNQETNGLVEKAIEISSKIITSEDYKQASEFQAKLKEWEKQVVSKRRSITVPIDNAKSVVMDMFKPITDAIEKAKSMVDRSRLDYEQKKELERMAEENRLALKAKKEAQELAEKAQKAREEGKEGKAIQLEAKAEMIQISPTVAPVIPQKIDGLSTRKTIWYAEVVDLSILPREYMIANEKMLDGMAKSTKGKIQIPGVVFKEKKSAA